MSRARATLAATIFFCAIALLSARLGDWAADNRGWLDRADDFHVSSGEALIHGVPLPEVAVSMPGFSVPNALLCQHAGVRGPLLARGLSLIADAVLVFALGWLLHSALCGGIAALLFALASPPYLPSDRWLYSLQILAVAVALVWRARSPSPWRDAVLALCLGMSLLILSPLFLFPFVLLGYGLVRDRHGRKMRAALLCLIPFLPLTIWAYMNWRLQHRLIIFEDGRAVTNIITGALGFVSTDLGARYADLGFSGGNPLIWAAQFILRHPGHYLWSIGRRLAYAASFHPFLYISALAGAWLGRKREEHKQLTLLIAYFLGIHCLMSVEMKYFEPMLPLLCALAACLLVARLRPAADRSAERFAAAALGATLAPILLVQVYALGLTAAYPGRASQESAFDRALRKHPADAWLWSLRGRNRLQEGDPAGAAQDLAQALSLAPRLAQPVGEIQAKYAWARMAQGGSGAGSWEKFPMGISDAVGAPPHYAFRALYLLLHGRREAARDALALMDDVRIQLPSFREADDDARLRPGRQNAIALDQAPIDEALSFWPSLERASWRAQLTRLHTEATQDPVRLGGLWIREAAAAKRFGLPETAHQALVRAERAPLGAGQARRVAELYGGLGLARDSAGPLLELAAAAQASGRRVEALAALGAACGQRLDERQLRATAALYAKLREPEKTEAVLRRLLAVKLFDLADAAAASRSRSLALGFVAQARRLKLRPEELGRAAISYQDLGEYRAALTVLDQLCREQPRQARWRNDRGVVKMLLGLQEQAVLDWKQAIAIDPRFLPPYLSLGTSLAAAGQRPAALRLYAQALDQTPPSDKGGLGIRERIRLEREKLR